MADRNFSLNGERLRAPLPRERAGCIQCEGMRWYRPAGTMDLRPCHLCLEAGVRMLPNAARDCRRCNGRGMYRLAYSRVMAPCPECLTRSAPAPDFSWRYQVDAQNRVIEPGAPMKRPRALFRERRSIRPGLLRGVLLGAGLAIVLMHLCLTWGER